MIQLIVFIIFIASVGGIGAMLYRKIPALVQLPLHGDSGIKKPEIMVKIQKRIQDHHFQIVEKKVPLHKFLSKIKILILKAERKVDILLQGIRKKAVELDRKGIKYKK